MRIDGTTYRGTRLCGEVGEVLGVRVAVNGRTLSPAASLKVATHNEAGFEWGYRGAGPHQLALALLLDATGDRALARRAYVWFAHAVVSQWGRDWRITAGEIRRWLDQWRREDDSYDEHPPLAVGCYVVRRCRACGCTDDDCRQCVAATGRPCSWVGGEDPPLCTRCAAEAEVSALLTAEGGGS